MGRAEKLHFPVAIVFCGMKMQSTSVPMISREVKVIQ